MQDTGLLEFRDIADAESKGLAGGGIGDDSEVSMWAMELMVGH